MSEQAPNKAGNEASSITEVLPGQRREGEGMTEFSIRRINNEMIERCAVTAERSWPRAHTYASENADIYHAQDHAVRTVVSAIRNLKR